MADAPSIQAKFWTSAGMSEKHASLVPGVNDVGNRRSTKVRVKGGKTKEVKAGIPAQQPVMVETTDSHGKMTQSSCLMSSDISTLGTDISALHARGVTLKDLCAEDKQRIANLIKELAKVGEEKENAEQNLSAERQHYQKQIMSLVQQQEAVLKEREDVQSRLLDYQSYIVKLQQQQQLQQLLQHQQKQQQKQRPNRNHTSAPVVKPEAGAPQPLPQQPLPLPVLPQPLHKGMKEEKNEKKRTSKEDHHHHHHLYHNRQPLRRDDNNDDDESDDEDVPVDQPSAHLYMNQTLEESTGPLDGLSTHVVPSQTPPPHAAVTNSSVSRPLPHRPFTAMIDKQLCEHRKKEAETVDDEEEGEELKNNDRLRPDMRQDGKKGQSDWRRNAGEDNREDEGRRDRERGGEGEGGGGYYPSSHQPLDVVGVGATVSPEKVEIFTRFMDSQQKEQRRNWKKSEVGGARARTGQSEEGRGGRGAIVGSGGEVKEEDEEMVERRKKEEKRNGGKKHPARKPPASYPGFYAPIMSSTQKSSEIGDYVSNIDSTIASLDAGMRDRRRHEEGEGGGRVDGYHRSTGGRRREEEDGGRERERGGGGRMDDDDFVGLAVDKDKKKTIMDNNRRSDDDMGGGRRRRQRQNRDGDVIRVDNNTDNPPHLEMDDDGGGGGGVNEEFLSYYKQLSASERKEELLKQRSQLMEEQGKLKGILERQAKRYESHTDHHEKKRKEDLIGDKGGKEESSPMGKVTKVPPSTTAMTAMTGSRRGVREVEEEGEVIRGTDGDVCVAYSNDATTHGRLQHASTSGSGRKQKDTLATRLDYSLCSDNDQDGLASSNLDRKFIIAATSPRAPTTNQQPDVTNSKSKMEASPLPTMVDAETSVSFATVSRKEGVTQTAVVNDDGLTHNIITPSNRRTADKQQQPIKSRFSESPGDKTLAVLNIINSLPDENPSIRSSSSVARSSLHHHQRHHRTTTRQSGDLQSKYSNNSGSSSSHHLNNDILKNTNTNNKKNDNFLLSKKKSPFLFSEEKNLGRREQEETTNITTTTTRRVRPFTKLEGFDNNTYRRTDTNTFAEGSAVNNTFGGGKEGLGGVGGISGGGGGIKRDGGRGWRRNNDIDENEELDVFDFTSWRNERMEGYRKIMNNDDKEDDDGDEETFYDYDSNDDSNIDGIVNGLRLASSRSPSSPSHYSDNVGGCGGEDDDVGGGSGDDFGSGRNRVPTRLTRDSKYKALDNKTKQKFNRLRREDVVDDNDDDGGGGVDVEEEEGLNLNAVVKSLNQARTRAVSLSPELSGRGSNLDGLSRVVRRSNKGQGHGRYLLSERNRNNRGEEILSNDDDEEEEEDFGGAGGGWSNVDDDEEGEDDFNLNDVIQSLKLNSRRQNNNKGSNSDSNNKLRRTNVGHTTKVGHTTTTNVDNDYEESSILEDIFFVSH